MNAFLQKLSLPYGKSLDIPTLEDTYSRLDILLIRGTLPQDLVGIWCSQYRSVVIDSTLSDIQYRCVLTHELAHIALGHSGCSCNSIEEARARKLTADLLLPQSEYDSEKRRSSNLWELAGNLNVTLEVLEEKMNI